MLSQEQKNELKAFYNALNDKPLTPDHEYYVPHFNGPQDPIEEIATEIDWSDSSSVHLLTGQRGNGKSTELQRLRQSLEKQYGCLVFLSDIKKYMNLTTPVEITDFLISLMAAFSEEAKKHIKDSPAERGYLERLSTFLQTEVNIEEVKLKTNIADFKASLHSDPTFKKKVQQALKGHVARIVQEAHDFAANTIETLRTQKGNENLKVVFIVDSLEQLQGTGAEEDKQVYDSVRNMFSAHADHLHLPMLHMVYTIPPYLIPLSPGIGRQLGGGMVVNLPSIHIRQQDGSEDSGAITVMREIIGKRNPAWQTIFSDNQLTRLALSSGGDLRDFFRLIRQVLVKAKRGNSLPVSDSVLEEAEKQLRREMLPIADADKEWLRRIIDSKDEELKEIADLPQLARFFDSRLVLNYRNGDDWYDVHPLLKDDILDN